MKNPFLLYAAIAFGAVFVGGTIVSRLAQPKKPSGIVEETSNPKLAEAVLRARSELPQFVEAFKAHPEAEFAVCGRFLTKNGPEQLWVKVDAYEKKVFRGVLAVDPVAYEKKKGDPIEVPEGIVVDWTYRLDGKTEGGYITKVLSGQ